MHVSMTLYVLVLTYYNLCELHVYNTELLYEVGVNKKLLGLTVLDQTRLSIKTVVLYT